MPQICFRAPCPENRVMGNGQLYERTLFRPEECAVIDLTVPHNFLLDTASEIL